MHQKFGETPQRAVSRQAIYTALEKYADTTRAEWEDAGCPSPQEAIAALEAVALTAVTACAGYDRDMDALATTMWQARSAGINAAAVADNCGLASKAAYEYLALQQDYEAVKDALGEMPDFNEDGPDEQPHASLRHRKLRIEVANNGEIDRRSLDLRHDRTEAELDRRLRKAGYAMDSESNGAWVQVRRLPSG